jgi:hypothetical protein
MVKPQPPSFCVTVDSFQSWSEAGDKIWSFWGACLLVHLGFGPCSGNHLYWSTHGELSGLKMPNVLHRRDGRMASPSPSSRECLESEHSILVQGMQWPQACHCNRSSYLQCVGSLHTAAVISFE